jgi:enterochelin esterase-like enzyme
LLIGLLIAGLAACAPPPVHSPTPIAPTATSPGLPPAETAVAPTPDPTETSAPAVAPITAICAETGGRLVNDTLATDRQRRPMGFIVYLPPCYDQLSEQRYPILYLLHGLNSIQDQWTRLGLAEEMDNLIAAGEIQPFIVVMPFELIYTANGEDPFEPILLDGLMPRIDASYRTLTDRAHRAIGGLSRGAGWAVRLGILHPQLFTIVGAHSLAIRAGDEQILNGRLLAGPVSDLPYFFLDSGDHDPPEILQPTLRFEALLTKIGAPHEWRLNTGYHEESYWRSHLQGYLRRYAAALDCPGDPCPMSRP